MSLNELLSSNLEPSLELSEPISNPTPHLSCTCQWAESTRT